MTTNATARANDTSTTSAGNGGGSTTAAGGSRSSGGAQQGQLAAVNINVSAAARYNKTRRYSRQQWMQVQEAVGAEVDGIPGPETARKIAAWQQANGLDVDGKVGPATMRKITEGGSSTNAGGQQDTSGADGQQDTDTGGGGGTDTSEQADSPSTGGQVPEGNVTANFSWAEFACNDRNNTPVPQAMRPRIEELCQQLEVLREAIGGKSITVNSGYRTPAYNKSVGGASQSQHVQCRASDLMVSGMSPRRVADTILRLIREGKMKQGGVGRYRGFTHYDIRGSAARWGSN